MAQIQKPIPIDALQDGAKAEVFRDSVVLTDVTKEKLDVNTQTIKTFLEGDENYITDNGVDALRSQGVVAFMSGSRWAVTVSEDELLRAVQSILKKK